MGIDQVSLFFIPQGWRQELISGSDLARAGKEVQIVTSVPSGPGDHRPITFDEVRAWLLDHGFTIANWGGGTIFERGQIRSTFGPQQEIQINVGEKAGEVVELYCRFTLPRRSAPPLDQWAALVVPLCREFRLRLADQDEGSTCDEAEVAAAVKAHPNYWDVTAGP